MCVIYLETELIKKSVSFRTNIKELSTFFTGINLFRNDWNAHARDIFQSYRNLENINAQGATHQNNR